MQDEGLMNTVKEEESLTADSGESTAGRMILILLETRDQRMKVTYCPFFTLKV